MRILENGLIPVYEDSFNGGIVKVTTGRELHKALKIKTPYTQWFERMKEYGFTENIDFVSLSQNCEKPQGGRPEINHIITLDMAKHIAMIQRNEIGMRLREYFIRVEEKFRIGQFMTPQSEDEIIIQSMQILQNRVVRLQLENQQLSKDVIVLGEKNQSLQTSLDRTNEELVVYQHRSQYFDEIIEKKNLLNTGDIAHDYGMSATQLNKILYMLKIIKNKRKWRISSKYLPLGLGSIQDIEKNGFTTSWLYWNQRGRYFIYVLLGNIGIEPTIERKAGSVALDTIEEFNKIWKKSENGENTIYFDSLSSRIKEGSKAAIKQFVRDLKDGRLDELMGEAEYKIEDVVESDFDMVSFYNDTDESEELSLRFQAWNRNRGR